MLGQEEPLGEEELESCAGEGVDGVKSAAGMNLVILLTIVWLY